MKNYVKAKMLTSESFAKFGKVIEKKPYEGDVSAEYVGFWNNLRKIDFDVDAAFGFMETRRQDIVIKELEKHMTSEDVFIPMQGVGVMPFAPAKDVDDPDELPDITEMELFVIDGTKGLVIDKGVWHWTPYPITQRMSLAIGTSSTIMSDLYIQPINEMYVVL